MIRLRQSGVDEILIKRVRDWYDPGPGVFIQSLATASFSPEMLFTGSTNGVYFDPNNSATLFEDAAGTIPTALERPVGLMLDQSKGLALGPELVTNGTFDSNINGWTQQPSVTASRDTSIFPSGALKIQATSSGSIYVEQSLGSNFIVGRKYKATATVYTSSSTPSTEGAAISFVTSSFTATTSVAQAQKNTAQTLTIYFTATSTTHSIYLAICTLDFRAWASVGSVAYFDNISVCELPGNHATSSSSTARPTLTRRVNQFVNSDTLATQSVTTRATTQTLRFEGTGTITLSGTATGVYAAGAYSVTTTAGTLTATVSGTVTRADLREANFGVGLPAYQSVGDTAINAADYDTTGFPAWLRCSGGQSMVTPSINFTGTDKMTVWAGVRKLSESSGMISELSAISDTSAGTFALTTLAAGKMYWTARGSVPTGDIQPSGFVAPTTNVLTGIGDIAGDVMQLRSNGARVATSSQDRGTGNYGNYPLYLFARNQASLFFNGLAGPIIVRGAQSSAAEIANAENWINAQQKVY